jgi:hypothetical protein
VRAAPAVSRARLDKENAHEHTGSAETLRPSLRNGFNGFLRALPGDRAFLPPSPLRSLLLKSLTPASGCQDHTTSPSAGNIIRLVMLLRPPHPAPTLVTMANAPLCGTGCAKCAADLGARAIPTGCGISTRRANQQLADDRAVKRNVFRKPGSTALSDLPVGQNPFAVQPSFPAAPLRI